MRRYVASEVLGLAPQPHKETLLQSSRRFTLHPTRALNWTCLYSDESEIQIVHEGGLVPILEGASSSNLDLQSQCARAMRNLSVNREQPFYCVHGERYVSRRVREGRLEGR